MVVAIYNCFDGLEILPYSIDNIRPLVDQVIIMYQTESNHGEIDLEVEQIVNRLPGVKHKFTPSMEKKPMDNERDKRELGLAIARGMGFEYFLDIDCDEFYDPYEFKSEFEQIKKNNLNGLVCDTQVYFGSPTLTIGKDITRVPFIHKIQGAKHVFNRKYPFAFDGFDIRIDPTRQLSFMSGIERSEMVMHHYSWVRKDFKKKIRNSSARVNIEKSNVMQQILLAKDGYYCDFYGKHLRECPNVFGLPLWQNTPGFKTS